VPIDNYYYSLHSKLIVLAADLINQNNSPTDVTPMVEEDV